MAERAAHLVDDVFPEVPVRQWVLSLPPRIRYQLAWDHDLCRAVVAVYLRAVLGGLRDRARRDGVAGGRGGAVAMVQRFGGALSSQVIADFKLADLFVFKGRALTQCDRLRRHLARHNGTRDSTGNRAPLGSRPSVHPAAHRVAARRAKENPWASGH